MSYNLTVAFSYWHLKIDKNVKNTTHNISSNKPVNAKIC